MSSNERLALAQRSHGSPATMPSPRTIGHREWTAMEKYKLKGLADRGMPTAKIARTLKRSLAITRAMALRLGIRLIDASTTPAS